MSYAQPSPPYIHMVFLDRSFLRLRISSTSFCSSAENLVLSSSFTSSSVAGVDASRSS